MGKILEINHFQQIKKVIKIKTFVYSFIIFIIFALLSFPFVNCSETISNNQDIVFPDSNVSFLIHVQPFLKFTCGYSNCHDEYYRAADVVLTEYFSIFTSYGGSLVLPYKPDQSVLIKIFEGLEVHQIPIYYRINDNQKRGMRKWIIEGARNN